MPLPDQMNALSIAESRHTARSKKLHEDLDVLLVEIDNLMFMLRLIEANGRYCQTCSPSEQIGVCGKGCALLAPENREVGLTFVPPESWIRDSVAQTDAFNKICKNLNEWGHDITDLQLRIWERKVGDMLSVCVSNLETYPEDKPSDVRVEFKEVKW
jgi:hypothetical protein